MSKGDQAVSENDNVVKFPKSHDGEPWETTVESLIDSVGRHATAFSTVVVAAYTKDGGMRIFFNNSNVASNVLLLERAKHYMAHEL